MIESLSEIKTDNLYFALISSLGDRAYIELGNAGTITLSVDEDISEPEKQSLQKQALIICGQFDLPDGASDWSVSVLDVTDRMQSNFNQTDIQRREHERSIKAKLQDIIPKELGYKGARLTWTGGARFARLLLHVPDKSLKLRILLDLIPEDFDPKKFTEEMKLRSELDLPEKVDIIFSTPNIFTKKGNLVN